MKPKRRVNKKQQFLLRCVPPIHRHQSTACILFGSKMILSKSMVLCTVIIGKHNVSSNALLTALSGSCCETSLLLCWLKRVASSKKTIYFILYNCFDKFTKKRRKKKHGQCICFIALLLSQTRTPVLPLFWPSGCWGSPTGTGFTPSSDELQEDQQPPPPTWLQHSLHSNSNSPTQSCWYVKRWPMTHARTAHKKHNRPRMG